MNASSTLIVTTPPHVKPLYADLRVPAVQAALASQQGSTFRTIPVNSPTSWNGWEQCPDGIQFGPAVHSSGPAPHARHAYKDLPTDGKFRDARWLLCAAINNSLIYSSTFASTEYVNSREQARVMAGFRRAIKSVCHVSL